MTKAMYLFTFDYQLEGKILNTARTIVYNIFIFRIENIICPNIKYRHPNHFAMNITHAYKQSRPNS